MGETDIRQRAEDLLRGPFRASILEPFGEAVRRYGLIAPGDAVAVCISGGKDSMLLAKLMQLYRPESPVPFTLRFLIMDPGYNAENRRRVEENARALGIPYDLFETDIFDVADKVEKLVGSSVDTPNEIREFTRQRPVAAPGMDDYQRTKNFETAGGGEQ